MNTLSILTAPLKIGLRVGCIAGLMLATGWSHAQTSGRIKPAPQPVAPALPAPGPGTPNPARLAPPFPAGLPSPIPNPAGLAPPFPAGLPSPIANPAGLVPPTPPSLSAPGVPAGSPPPPDDPPFNAAVPQTNVMGAGAYGGGVATRPTAGIVAGPYTAVQVAQSFIGADFNRDGELTPAEAQRLTIVPYSLEEMDRNHDGIITRFEYDDAFR